MASIPTIAIIDDDASIRIAVDSLVRSLGFTSLAFAFAEDVLASEAMEEVSCLILDLQRNLVARGSRTPIIFITAFTDPQLREQAGQVGAIGLLTKPFAGDTLVEYFEQALQQP